MNYKLLLKMEIEANQVLAKKVVELRGALGKTLEVNTKVIALLQKYEKRVADLESELKFKDNEIEKLRQEVTQIGLSTMGEYRYV